MKSFKISNTITLKSTSSIEHYLREISKYEPLNKAEERELFMRYNDGDIAAKEVIINHNLKFVVSVAKRYQYNYNKLELGDLINYGNMGLLRAFEKYNIELNFKFITYAVWWIRQFISENVGSHNSVIESPQSVYVNQAKVKKYIREFTQTHQREPSVLEVEDYIEEHNLNVNTVTDLYNQSISSLDNQIPQKSGDYFTQHDVIPCSDEYLPDYQYEENNHKELVNDMLDMLNDREKAIIVMCHGLCGTKEMSLEEIGEEMGVTPERVRQLKKKALTKLQKEFKGNRVFKLKSVNV
jgi:RNA polymerase primary sigma factor